MKFASTQTPTELMTVRCGNQQWCGARIASTGTVGDRPAKVLAIAFWKKKATEHLVSGTRTISVPTEKGEPMPKLIEVQAAKGERNESYG